MRALVATDAWEPQINGVVRTLQQVKELSPAFGVETKFVTPGDFRSAPMPGYPEIRLAFATASALRSVIRSYQPDVVHVATEGPIGFAARSASVALNVPLTTSYHTRFPEYLRARAPVPVSLSYAFMRRFHRVSSGILVSTQSLADELHARGFRNLMRWSRGVNLGLFKPRVHSTVAWARPVFLNVGRVAVEKNLEAFLDLDLPGTKVVVGDGPLLPSLRAAYPGVVFTGAKAGQELAELYAQADVFVFPSVTDTFGVVILEALGSGLPIAAYPVTGPQDILGGQKAGVLSTDLRQASLDCLTIGTDACVELASRYTWQSSIQEFCQNLAIARQNAESQQRSAA